MTNFNIHDRSNHLRVSVRVLLGESGEMVGDIDRSERDTNKVFHEFLKIDEPKSATHVISPEAQTHTCCADLLHRFLHVQELLNVSP